MISAEQVKTLREMTGAGMMDCKKALTECGGNMDEAVDWLRKKGLSAAAKKAGRVAAEGLIGVAVSERSGALVEVNAETDFVGRNEQFQVFVRTVTELALAQHIQDVDALKKEAYPGTGRSVEEELTHLIAVIGENMALRRVVCLSVKEGVVASYVHNTVVPGLGRIGVLVGFQTDAPRANIESVAKSVAMHVAAASPQALSRGDIDPELVRREQHVVEEQARASGRPEEVVQKMVEGRMAKFFDEVVLLDQTSMLDESKRPIKVILKDLSDRVGSEVSLTGFARFQLGEGIEKEEKDFAAEVAAQLK